MSKLFIVVGSSVGQDMKKRVNSFDENFCLTAGTKPGSSHEILRHTSQSKLVKASAPYNPIAPVFGATDNFSHIHHNMFDPFNGDRVLVLGLAMVHLT